MAVFCLLISLVIQSDRSRGAERTYTVSVYKQVNGRWVKQEDRTLKTSDETKAREYEQTVNGYRGWSAKSNLPDRSIAHISHMEPGDYVVQVTAVNRDGTTMTVKMEPTGRTLKIPLQLKDGRIPHRRGAEYPATLVGKRVILGLGRPSSILGEWVPGTLYPYHFTPLADSDSPSDLELFGDLLKADPNRLEVVWGRIMTHERGSTYQNERWVMGKLAWPEGIDPKDIRSGVDLLEGGAFFTLAKKHATLAFSHPDCVPVLLKVEEGQGPQIFKDLALERLTAKNSGMLRVPLSEDVIAALKSKPPPNLAIMPVPPDEDLQRTDWPGFVDAPNRNRALDVSSVVLNENAWEARVPVGDYAVHVFLPGCDRYLERVTVAAGETQSLPVVKLPPLTYVVANYCKHDGIKAELDKMNQVYYVTDLYGHSVSHSLDSGRFGNLAGAEFMLLYHFMICPIVRNTENGIHLCIATKGFKVAELGEGKLADYADLGGKEVTWQEEAELTAHKEPAAAAFKSGLFKVEPGFVWRGLPIRKGRVYRIDGGKQKYIVEVVEITSDFAVYNKLLGNMYDNARDLSAESN